MTRILRDIWYTHYVHVYCTMSVWRVESGTQRELACSNTFIHMNIVLVLTGYFYIEQYEHTIIDDHPVRLRRHFVSR